VSHELAGELGVRDTGVLWNVGPKRVDRAFGVEGCGDLSLRTLVARMLLVVAGKKASSIAFANVGCAPVDIEAAASRVGDDLVGLDGARLASVELVDAPALQGSRSLIGSRDVAA
jgi:hypothetical protein